MWAYMMFAKNKIYFRSKKYPYMLISGTIIEWNISYMYRFISYRFWLSIKSGSVDFQGYFTGAGPIVWWR